MAEKLPTVTRYQNNPAEQRKLVINCERAKEMTGRGHTKCQAKPPQSYSYIIRNPWLLRCGVALVVIVFIVTLVTLYTKMHDKVETLEVKLVALQKKVDELEDRIHCSVIESSGTDSHGKSCAQHARKPKARRQFAAPTASAPVQNTEQAGGLSNASRRRTNVKKQATRKLSKASDGMRTNTKEQTTSAQRRAHASGKVVTSATIALYVAWGVSKCPVSERTKTLYSGTVASSKESAFLCLPSLFHYLSPENISDTDRVQLRPVRYGNSMSLVFQSPSKTLKENHARNNSEVPCALCEHSGRSAVLVEPTAISCFQNWGKAYNGYLMTSGTEVICVHRDAESININDGRLQGRVSRLQFTQYAYKQGYKKHQALACVVCLK